MIGLQKRFIYAVIPAIIVFIILYLILNFYLWLSILISAPAYIAGIFLFKVKDLREYDPKALARYQYELSRLHAYKDKIKDKEIKERIKNIVDTCQKLTKYLGTKPEDATPIYTALDYYLPFANERITEYTKLEDVDDKTFVENKLILKFNVYLREIEQECNKLYKETLNSKDKKINYEMKKFERLSDFEDDEGNKIKWKKRKIFQ